MVNTAEINTRAGWGRSSYPGQLNKNEHDGSAHHGPDDRLRRDGTSRLIASGSASPLMVPPLSKT